MRNTTRMVRAVLLVLFCQAAVAAVPALAGDMGVPPKPARPNLIWILLDAARAENLSVCGYSRPTTPALERLAKNGVVFLKNYSQATMTHRSVGSYMSGRYIPATQLWRGAENQVSLAAPPGECFFPQIAHLNGYRTHWVVTNFGVHVRSIFDSGTYLASNKPNTGFAELDQVVDYSMSWISEHKGEPFFLYLHTIDTHFPHIPKPGFDQWLPQEVPNFDVPPIDDKKREYLRGLYDDSLLFADTQIGRLIGLLSDQGLMDSTMIVVSSDHGELLGEDGKRVGHFMDSPDELVHVPLIMAGPGLPKNVRVDSFTENVDIVPTLVELLGLDPGGAVFDGKSLMPLLRPGQPGPAKETVFSVLYDASGGVTFLARNADYLYECNPKTGKRALYSTPNAAANRVDVLSGFPDAAAALDARVTEVLAPCWRQYVDLPPGIPAPFLVFFSNDGCMMPKQNFVSEGEKRDGDNRWLVAHGGIEAQAREMPRPLECTTTVPAGRYRVLAIMPKSAVLGIRVQDEPDVRYIETKPGNEDAPVELGVYRLSAGAFELHLEKRDKEHPAGLLGLQFIPVGADDQTKYGPGEEKALTEQLKALGYL